MKPNLTPQIAHAAGADAGNRAMRQGHRAAWSLDDYQVACREANRLLDAMGAL